MQPISHLLRALLLALLLVGGCRAMSAREVLNFNRGWRYAAGDFPAAALPTFNDSGWQPIGLPHSFSIPYFMSKDFYVGYGWYRKSFELSKRDLKKLHFLEFDGVFQEAEVFVNGQLAGHHVGGYTGFQVALTPHVKAGHNVVAVRVNNIWHPDVAPRAGEHTFSGGIYRNVRLVRKSPVHIAWYGTAISTPGLAAARGVRSAVHVATEVCNRSKRAGDFRVVTEILAPGGASVKKVSSSQRIAAETTAVISQQTTAVEKPQLWSPESPQCYKAVVRLYEGGKLLDETTTDFGFRWFEWTADKGFFFNGKHCHIQGANVHQDQAGWGDAVTDAAARRDVHMMKEAGFNFIRGSHYPHSPAFSSACDKEGMLFWSEAPFWGIGGYKADGYWDSGAYPQDERDAAAFEESALQQLGEMIRIHRNHPSIVAWSMCNEAFFTSSNTLPGVRRLLKRMVDLTHHLDATRPAAIGGAQRPLGNARIDKIGDITGYNGDGATQQDFQNPGIPNLVSEYGSVTADRPGQYAPGWGDLAKNDTWKGYPWRSGQAIWCGFDHGSIAGSALGKMGIVDYFRVPKRSWYWYRDRAQGKSKEPTWPDRGEAVAVKLQADKTRGVKADGTDDVFLSVGIVDANGRALSNSPDVTLTVVSGPGEFPTGKAITFSASSDIVIRDGQAAITLRSYYGGSTVVEATSDGLQSARIDITFEGAPKYKAGKSPETTQRAYQPYQRKTEENAVQRFGTNNPTFAGSSSRNFSAGLATDGNEETFWKPLPEDAEPWIMVDTEKRLDLKEIDFKLAKEYTKQGSAIVETSLDGKLWQAIQTVGQVDLTTGRIGWKQLPGKPKASGRFVRLRFNGCTSVAVREITIHGIVLQ